MRGLKAGIIAAGEGSRLRAEGITIPKPLVSLNGVPLIERLIRTFAHHGFREIICIVNAYSLQVKEFVESKQFAVPVRFVVKTTPSSMHSLFELAPYFQDGHFLLSAVDSVFHEGEFAQYVRYARCHQSKDGILAITNYVDDENPLYVQLHESKRITGFSRSEPTKWVTGGLYMFSPRIFQEKENVFRQGIERLRNFLGYLVKQGYYLEGFPFSEIIDVDDKQDIAAAERLFEVQ
jgi:NDP-sugar pyrophosphorylase family protein